MLRLRNILLLLALALHAPVQAQAAVTFFWSAEDNTLAAFDGDPDYSASDGTATANGSPAINGTGALVGSNGIVIDAANEHYRFDADATIINRLTGSVGFWFRYQSWPGAGTLFYVRDNTFSDNILLKGSGTDELSLVINDEGTSSTLTTTAVNLAADTTYFVTFSWDQPNSDRRICVYDSTGTLVAACTEDTATAFTAPAALVFSDGLRIGEAQGAASGSYYLDNIFIGDAYADADGFLTNRSITTYTAYGGGGGGGATVKDMTLLGVGR